MRAIALLRAQWLSRIISLHLRSVEKQQVSCQYSKRFMTPLYFWPWAVGEMWAIVCDAKLALDFDIFFKRCTKFGGILRNVLGEDVRAGEMLNWKTFRWIS